MDLKYFESCAECDSLNLKIFNVRPAGDHKLEFEVECRDCGAEWMDFQDDENP